MNYGDNRYLKTKGIWSICALSVLLLIVSGIAFRVLAARLRLLESTPVMLPVPLNAFPKQVGRWSGEDVPIPEGILRVARTDDSLNRLYRSAGTNAWVNVYVAYTARPRTMIGHRPEVCYVGGGWVHDGSRSTEFVSASGRNVPCVIHRFHMPGPQYEERIVLNFYIVNGQLTSDENTFSGVGWRTPNIGGDPARYAAQVQISSVLENAIRKAAADITDLIMDFFPDEDGKVRAAQFINSGG